MKERYPRVVRRPSARVTDACQHDVHPAPPPKPPVDALALFLSWRVARAARHWTAARDALEALERLAGK